MKTKRLEIKVVTVEEAIDDIIKAAVQYGYAQAFFLNESKKDLPLAREGAEYESVAQTSNKIRITRSRLLLSFSSCRSIYTMQGR